MTPQEALKRSRLSAPERREQVVEIALRHFAIGGYRGTSTDAIANEAGVSQPYLFRLFGTKRDLFLACCDRCHEAVIETFRRAAEDVEPDQRFSAMGRAYTDLLEDRTLLLFQMQTYAASSDPVIRARVRTNYVEIVREVARLSDADLQEVWGFTAQGMLLNVIASLDLPSSDDPEIAAMFSRPGEMSGYAEE